MALKQLVKHSLSSMMRLVTGKIHRLLTYLCSKIQDTAPTNKMSQRGKAMRRCPFILCFSAPDCYR